MGRVRGVAIGALVVGLLTPGRAAWSSEPVAPFSALPRGQAPCPEGSARADSVYATGFESGIPEPSFADGWGSVATSAIEGSRVARSQLSGSSSDPEDYFYLPVVKATGATYLGFASRGTFASGHGRAVVNSVVTSLSGSSTWTGRVVDITEAVSDEGGLLMTWFSHTRTAGVAAGWDVDNVQIFTCRAAPTARITGADRYAVSAALADAYPEGVGVAYVARGDVYPDALGAVPVAAGDHAPILLVRPGEIPATVDVALQRLRPKRIVILGGTTSIEPAVATQLATYTKGKVSRVAGPDRYAVSAALSRATHPTGAPHVYVASGEVFADALAAAPLAAGATAQDSDSPLLLVRRSTIPPAVATELRRLRPATITVVGGPSTVHTEVLAAMRTLTGAAIERIYGPDRYAVSAQVAALFGPELDGSYLASGEDFPDAVLGSALAGSRHEPLLLTKGTELPDAVRDRLTRLADAKGTVVGGEASVASIVRDEYGRTLP